MTKDFKLALKAGKFYLYSKVTIKKSIRVIQNDEKCSIKFNNYFDEEWKGSVSFAVNYFQEHFKERVDIEIVDLHTMTADSSTLTVVYVVVQCLCELFEFNKELIRIHKAADENVLFEFLR